MMKKLSIIIVLIMAAGMVFSSSGCSIFSDDDEQTAVSKSAGSTKVKLMLGRMAEESSLKAGLPDRGAMIPPFISEIEIKITGDGMSAITKTINTENIAQQGGMVEETLDIPTGDSRLIEVKAYDARGTVVFEGSTKVDLDGTETTVTIIMKPPAASGLTDLTVTLMWLGANGPTSSVPMDGITQISFFINGPDMGAPVARIINGSPYFDGTTVSETLQVPSGSPRMIMIESDCYCSSMGAFSGSIMTDLLQPSESVSVMMSNYLICGC